MKLNDLDKMLKPFEARTEATRRLEVLDSLSKVSRLEIRLIGLGHDVTGTAGRTDEIRLTDDEARIVIKAASEAIHQTLQNATQDLEALGVEGMN